MQIYSIFNTSMYLFLFNCFKSNTVTTKGVAKKKKQTNLIPAEPKNPYQEH